MKRRFLKKGAKYALGYGRRKMMFSRLAKRRNAFVHSRFKRRYKK